MNKIPSLIKDIELQYKVLGKPPETSQWLLKQEIRAYCKKNGLGSIELQGGQNNGNTKRT